MKYSQDRALLSAFGQGTCLSELDTHSLTAIIQVALKRIYAKGEIVCLEGEPCPGLFIIETGWLTGIKISPEGREQEIRLAGPGEMINEISVMGGETNLITLKSLDASTVWLIERETLFDLMSKHPMLNQLITKNLAKRVVQLLNLVEDLSLRNVEGRLAHLLLNRSENGVIKHYHWSTQAEIAASIGTTSVSSFALLTKE